MINYLIMHKRIANLMDADNDDRVQQGLPEIVPTIPSRSEIAAVNECIHEFGDMRAGINKDKLLEIVAKNDTDSDEPNPTDALLNYIHEVPDTVTVRGLKLTPDGVAFEVKYAEV